MHQRDLTVSAKNINKWKEGVCGHLGSVPAAHWRPDRKLVTITDNNGL